MIYSSLALTEADFENLMIYDYLSIIFGYLLVCLYLHCIFADLVKVMDQSIARELNSHRKIAAIFNSL